MESTATQVSIAEHRRQVMRYWEVRRWAFNAAMVIPTLLGYLPGAVISSGVGDHQNFGWFEIAIMLALACAAANACFSVVYIPEFVLMGRKNYERFARYRSLLLVAGILLGMLLAYAVAHEIFWLQFNPMFAP